MSNPSQPPLLDTDHEPIAPLNDLATQYVELRDRRMAVGRQEKAKKDEILGVMEENKLTEYSNGAVSISVEPSNKVTVAVKGVEAKSDDKPDAPDVDETVVH